MSLKSVPDAPGLQPVTVDFALKRGLWVKGRVLEKGTGKPVRAMVQYVAFEDNAFRNDAPGWTVELHMENRADDGSFRFPGLPGHTLVGARAWGDEYLVGVGAEGLKPDKMGLLRTYPNYCFVNTLHTLAELNPPKGAREVTRDLILDRGQTATVRVVGPDGKPLTCLLVSGRKAYGAGYYFEHEASKSNEVTVLGLRAGESRRVLALHQGKKLAGSAVVKAGGGPVTLKLVPWATLTGRVVTADGQPRSDVTFLASTPAGSGFGSLPQHNLQPGKDGKFRIEGLVPGVKYNIIMIKEGYLFAGNLTAEVTLKPGETKSLGDVQTRPGD
jgi:hypothetical protein